MPYRLRKAPKRDLYWVIDDKGKHYSKDPLSKDRARQQQKALYAAESRGEMKGGVLEVKAAPSGEGWFVMDGERRVSGPYRTKSEAEANLEEEDDELAGLMGEMSMAEPTARPSAPAPAPAPPRKKKPVKEMTTIEEDEEEEEPSAGKKRQRKGKGKSPMERALLKKPAMMDIEYSINKPRVRRILAKLPPGVAEENLPRRDTERLAELREVLDTLAARKSKLSKDLERMYRIGYGLKGGATVEEAQAAWAAVPTPPKNVRETEDQYQARLLRIKEQNERLASQGTTPSLRSANIAATRRSEKLTDLATLRGEQSGMIARLSDPEEIARRQRYQASTEQSGIDKFLEGLVDFTSIASSIIPGIGGTIGGLASEYLKQGFDQKTAQREAAKEFIKRRDYNEKFVLEHRKGQIGKSEERLGVSPGMTDAELKAEIAKQRNFQYLSPEEQQKVMAEQAAQRQQPYEAPVPFTGPRLEVGKPVETDPFASLDPYDMMLVEEEFRKRYEREKATAERKARGEKAKEASKKRKELRGGGGCEMPRFGESRYFGQ